MSEVKPRIAEARVHRWINTETMEPKYGVQVRVEDRWHHLAVGGQAALFDTPEEAEDKAVEIMRQVEADRAGGEMRRRKEEHNKRVEEARTIIKRGTRMTERKFKL